MLDVCSIESISLMSAAPDVAVGAGGVVRFPPPYPVDEYILRYVPLLDARQFAMMPVGQILTIMVGNGERAPACPGWRRRWKH